MENPIGIILLIIAGVIYKVYQGYKEEQAKAKKRMEKLKKTVKQRDTIFKEHPAGKPRTSPTLLGKPQPRKRQMPVNDYPEFQTPVPIPSESRTHEYKRPAKRVTSPRGLDRPIEIKEDPAPEIGSKRVEFDLRQAIIQQAILNRPYID